MRSITRLWRTTNLRVEFLAEISAGDVSLRQEVESLLKRGASADGFLISWTKIMDEYKT